MRGGLFTTGLGRRRQVEGDVLDELAFHIQAHAEDLMDSGSGEDDARASAVEAFGDVQQIAESCVQIQMETRVSRLVFLSGSIVSVAGLSACVVLAIVIASALWVNPLSFPTGEKLVRVGTTWDNARISADDFLAYRERVGAFERLTSFFPTELHGRRAMMLWSSEYFDVLGVNAIVGTQELNSSPRSAQISEVLISETFWRSEFQARPDVVGTRWGDDSMMLTVAGVMPASAQLSHEVDLWAIAPDIPVMMSENSEQFFAIGMLAEDVDAREASAEFTAVTAALEREVPLMQARTPHAVGPLKNLYLEFAAPHFRKTLLYALPTIALMLVLFIVCVRRLARRREILTPWIHNRSPLDQIPIVLTGMLLGMVLAMAIYEQYSSWFFLDDKHLFRVGLGAVEITAIAMFFVLVVVVAQQIYGSASDGKARLRQLTEDVLSAG